ncbi:MAG: GAF domain-containing protein [Planctomycetes bacterium]|nr:GAF domain-containing protein [Planctomycetota bacterium]
MNLPRARDDQHLLLKAIHAVTGGGSLHATLSTLLQEALDSVGGKLGWVAIVEAEGLRIEAIRGESSLGRGDVIPFGKGLTGKAYYAGAPYYAPDVAKEEQYWEVSSAVRSEFLVPLAASGEVVGVLNVESTQVDGFSAEDRELVAALGELAGNAVALVKRHEDMSGDLERATRSLQQRVAALKALNDAVKAVSSSLDVDDVVRVILERARDVTQADDVHLMLKDEDGAYVLHTSTSEETGRHVDIDSGVTGWVIRNGQALLVPDVTVDGRYVSWHESTMSELAVPLVDGGSVVGALNFESARLAAFDSFHLELAAIFAGHAVVAITNARLYSSLENMKQDLALTEALRAAGEVAGDVVHYVANKVGALPQSTRLIRGKIKGRLPAEDEALVLKLLDLIGKAAQEVLSLKGQILDTTKSLAADRVCLGPLVNELVGRSFSGGVKVVVAGDMDTMVVADRYALVRLLDNAFANALRALKTVPEPAVKIRWQAERDFVEIHVSDNGPGFPEDVVVSGIIPKFGDAAGDKGGSGMGLWLSQRLAARMGGSMSIGNSRGGGAYVRIRLPLCPADRQV